MLSITKEMVALASIIIGLPTGYYLTSWLFKACLDDRYDFGVHINISTYIKLPYKYFFSVSTLSSCITTKSFKMFFTSVAAFSF